MGTIQGQLAQGAIQKVKVHVQGPFDDFKPFMLAFIKGLLNDRIPDRVNFINAEFLAKERGIIIEYGANNEDGSYTNLINSCVVFDNMKNMLDGSDVVADWPLLNFSINAVSGASWVSFSQGGNGGIGNSLHTGMVIVADGTKNKDKRLERVLTNDPGLGIARYADAGYKAAKKFASSNKVNLPKK